MAAPFLHIRAARYPEPDDGTRLRHACCIGCYPLGCGRPVKAVCGATKPPMVNIEARGGFVECVVCLDLGRLDRCPVCGTSWR